MEIPERFIPEEKPFGIRNKEDVSDEIPYDSSCELPDIRSEMFARKMLTDGLNPRKAGKELFNSPTKGINLLNSENVKQRVKYLMMSNGLSLSDIVDKHKDLLNAKKYLSTKNEGVIEVNDNTTQLGALNLAYDVWGVSSNKEEKLTHSHTHSVEVSEESISRLQAISDEIKKLNTVNYIDVEAK